MNRIKVLVVEDEANFSQLLKYYLEHVGDFEVWVEGSGDAVVQSARKFQPDIALIDLVLPDVNGRAVARELHAEPGFGNLPVLFFSGNQPEDQVEFNSEPRNGMAFLTKPLSPRKLMNCIYRLLENPNDEAGVLALSL